MNAYVLINVSRKQVEEVAQRLARLDNVKDVAVVAGQYDLLAEVEGPDKQELAGTVIEEMVDINGIERSETLFSLRSYS